MSQLPGKLSLECEAAHTRAVLLANLQFMQISNAEKRDVISSVLIEMERMFTVLCERFPVQCRDQNAFVHKIEADFKSKLVFLDLRDLSKEN